MRYVEGKNRNQYNLLPTCLDDVISKDNPVRFIDDFVESLDMAALGFTHALVRRTGRPPYNPKDLLKLYIYGCYHGINSSRKLEQQSKINIEVMWLLHQVHPDFKTIADFRRANQEPFAQTCVELVRLCHQKGLVGGTLVAIDGSKLKASASKAKHYSVKQLQKLTDHLDKTHRAYLEELAHQDRLEAHWSDEAASAAASDEEPPVDGAGGGGSRKAEEQLASVSRRREAIQDRIERLERRRAEVASRQEELERAGCRQMNLSDADSRMMKLSGTRHHQVSYNIQIAVDSKHKLIVGHQVTNQETDLEQLAPMALQAKANLAVTQLEATVDAGYFNVAHLEKCEQDGITVYVPRIESSNHTGKGLYQKRHFIYDKQRDQYICPAGARLSYRGSYYDKSKGKELLQYHTPACGDCRLRAKCTTRRQGRCIRRLPNEDVIERHQALYEQNRLIARQRSSIVEHVFGTLKAFYQNGRLLTRGLAKVRGECALMVLSYNLRRLFNIAGAQQLLKHCNKLQGAVWTGYQEITMQLGVLWRLQRLKGRMRTKLCRA